MLPSSSTRLAGIAASERSRALRRQNAQDTERVERQGEREWKMPARFAGTCLSWATTLGLHGERASARPPLGEGDVKVDENRARGAEGWSNGQWLLAAHARPKVVPKSMRPATRQPRTSDAGARGEGLRVVCVAF